MDTQELKKWIGSIDEREDVVSVAPLELFAATLDFPNDASMVEVRPLWHWLYFLPTARLSEIGADGHPQRGGFLPPVPLPRRMWAGSRLNFHQALKVGEKIRRQSVISDVAIKEGKSGSLVFVVIKHTISNQDGVAIDEEHTVVYRDVVAPDRGAVAARPIPYKAQFSRRIFPDSVLLFRYSALTFNSHRIHYDKPYAVNEEGYPDLVVHGPLCATLLIEEAQHQFPGRQISSFEFKAVSPLFANVEFGIGGCLEGNIVHLWTETSEGNLGMLATAELA